MAVLSRMMMLFVAYVMACIAASAVLTIGVFTPAWHDLAASLDIAPADLASTAVWFVVGIGAAIIFALAILPAMLVIVLAEALGVRSIVVYGVTGAGVALAMSYGLDVAGYASLDGGEIGREYEVLAASGIAAGLVYWLFAGRSAGIWK